MNPIGGLGGGEGFGGLGGLGGGLEGGGIGGGGDSKKRERKWVGLCRRGDDTTFKLC